MKYDPESFADRTALAAALHQMLTTAGFAKMDTRGEDVYEYQCIGGSSILVYSSIVNGVVRGDGEDAIRVSAIYRRKDGQVRGLFKDTRVNRTGDVIGIVDRTRQRMRAAYVSIRERQAPDFKCRACGAPLFLAKSGKMVCAETCWIKN